MCKVPPTAKKIILDFAAGIGSKVTASWRYWIDFQAGIQVFYTFGSRHLPISPIRDSAVIVKR